MSTADNGEKKLTLLSLGLDLSSDSETDSEETSPRVNRLLNESASVADKPAEGAGDASKSPGRRSPRRKRKKAKPNSNRAAKKAIICQRCPPSNRFVDHREGCTDEDKFCSFVDCPRCGCILVSRTALRKHLNTCMRGPNRQERRNRLDSRKHVRYTFDPLKLLTCNNCKTWQHEDGSYLAVHELFCGERSAGAPAPALMAHHTFYPDCKEIFKIPLQAAVRIKKLMTDKRPLRRNPKFADLLKRAEQALVTAPPQTVVENNLPWTCSSPPSPPRSRVRDLFATPPDTSLRPVSYSYTATVNKAAWQGRSRGHMRGHAPNPCGQRELKRPAALGLGALSPTAIQNEATVQVNVRGITFVKDDKTAVVTPRPKKSRWDNNAATSTAASAAASVAPSVPPIAPTSVIKRLSPQTAAATVNDPQERKDRFKILLPSNAWVDAYGRSTSPRREHKKLLKKPSPTMSGRLASLQKPVQPALVAVDGHLPSGWGVIVVQQQEFPAYKVTPGDLNRAPADALAFTYNIPMFLSKMSDGSQPAAGPLHTNCDLSQFKTAEYRAAGITSRLTMTL